jgi:hypothetical protein
MDTPSIGTKFATPEVEQTPAARQTAVKDTGTVAAQTAALPAQDRSTATPRAEGAAPVAAEAAFKNTVSLSDFLSGGGFRTGNRIDLDGPMWYNGSGKIEKMDDDHLKLSITGKIGNGNISLDRKSGDTFTATVALDGKTFTMTMKAVRHGNKLDLVDVSNKANQLHFTVKNGLLNLNPDGLGIPGSVDITKK